MEILEKLFNSYLHLPSWVLAIIGFVSTWLGDSKELLLYILVVVVLDTIFGILRAKKQKIGIKSSGLRSMLSKLTVYFIMIVCTICLDKAGCFDSIIITRVCTGLILGAEGISIFGSLGILYPKVVAISLVRKFLESEMADKLHTDKEELEKMIKEGNNKEGENKDDENN